MKANASAGLRLETAPGFFMTHVAQASISAVLSALCLTSSVDDASADLLRGQTSALATLAKAAITMIAMITVPPKKAMFG